MEKTQRQKTRSLNHTYLPPPAALIGSHKQQSLMMQTPTMEQHNLQWLKKTQLGVMRKKEAKSKCKLNIAHFPNSEVY